MLEKKCLYCNKLFTSNWKYCSERCVDLGYNRQQKELRMARTANEIACLNYQTEYLRLEVLCSREMCPPPLPVIVDEEGNPLR